MSQSYFFVGVGGSGMLPLAMILRQQGFAVAGSDRSLDQGRIGAKFDYLRAQGIDLYAQDGGGVTRADQIVVASAAIEETVPDIQSTRRVGATLMTRAELLAQLFNAAPTSIGVAGTSGKSTTTAMLAWILQQTGMVPTVMNGAVMKNFATPDAPFASALVGAGNIFVSEVDESDGSIARYKPRIAIVNNIALDHKSMDELRALFTDFAGKAETAVLNADNGETAALASKLPARKLRTFSLRDANADLFASNLTPAPDGIAFTANPRGAAPIAVRLKVPGAHNVANGLAAMLGAQACGVPLDRAGAALARFAGVARRLALVGQSKGVVVIDDFAHNPDKITATLATLHDFPGRLLIMFQPHGFGPLKLMRTELIECFAKNMSADDVLVMPDPVYFGGTTDRSVSSPDIVAGVTAAGRHAQAFTTRDECGAKILQIARPGDRIVVMGARDDTLTTFAEELLARIRAA